MSGQKDAEIGWHFCDRSTVSAANNMMSLNNRLNAAYGVTFKRDAREARSRVHEH